MIEASEAQRRFLSKLLNDAGMSEDELEAAIKKKVSSLGRDSMSRLIDLFVNIKDKNLLLAKLPEMHMDEDPQISREIQKQENKPVQKTEPKNKMIIEKITDRTQLMASLNGIPKELANMYFMIISDQLYIKSPGLLYMASKKGYARIDIQSEKDGDSWKATALIFPLVPIEVLKGLSGLSPEMQKHVLETQYGPTIGNGKADKTNVTSKMASYLREMAETRAVNRALRLYTGYGGTSYEELPESNIEVD